ncbi:MAG: DUF5672 family protein [Lachnospiraceae bacterium]|nr:DUF5672 family protein [Lachnospiraceae bacterium]
MDISAYKDFDIDNFIPFSDKHFGSNKTYSRLILSEEFYQPFLDYEYMLIAQTDTYILNTDYTLKYFIDQNFDYWGAPWPNGPFDLPYGPKEWFKSVFVNNPKNLHVGNGGFSLRKVAPTYKLVKKHHTYIKYVWRLNEDLFFSNMASKPNSSYVSAPVDEAAKFALETNMQEEIDKGNIPFAVHAWEKYFRKKPIFFSTK